MQKATLSFLSHRISWPLPPCLSEKWILPNFCHIHSENSVLNTLQKSAHFLTYTRSTPGLRSVHVSIPRNSSFLSQGLWPMDVSLSSNNRTLRDMQSILDFLGSLHEWNQWPPTPTRKDLLHNWSNGLDLTISEKHSPYSDITHSSGSLQYLHTHLFSHLTQTTVMSMKNNKIK